MAGQFLASHGIDLGAEMARIQIGGESLPSDTKNEASCLAQTHVSKILGVRLPQRPAESLWDITVQDGKIAAVDHHDRTASEKIRHLPGVLTATGQLLAPSLCHVHVHLDKCFLLRDPKFTDLAVMDGSFQEAMDITAKAKARFDIPDLTRRGRELIEESISYGVTAMRAFVEVDDVVHFKCLEAAVTLKREFARQCDIQICAFAQHALFSGPDNGERNRELMTEAASWEEVEVLGSTPYVEYDIKAMKLNVEWIIELSKAHIKHLDFHLDYHLDEAKEPLVWFVVETLRAKEWQNVHPKTCALGHCTRLTYFDQEDWKKLREAIDGMNVSFVGLPTSDLYMMRTRSKTRGTLAIPELIKHYGVEAAIGVNNVGNAFTPQGNCDPLSVACLGVGVYQAGTKENAELLYECVSQRAKRVVGYNITGSHATLDLKSGEPADFVLFEEQNNSWKANTSISHVVYEPSHARQVIKNGRLTSWYDK
ncbi:MAG: hypothetical protein Q9165_000194 [Trypethelium subeluteriae]